MSTNREDVYWSRCIYLRRKKILSQRARESCDRYAKNSGISTRFGGGGGDEARPGLVRFVLAEVSRSPDLPALGWAQDTSHRHIRTTTSMRASYSKSSRDEGYEAHNDEEDDYGFSPTTLPVDAVRSSTRRESSPLIEGTPAATRSDLIRRYGRRLRGRADVAPISAAPPIGKGGQMMEMMAMMNSGGGGGRGGSVEGDGTQSIGYLFGKVMLNATSIGEKVSSIGIPFLGVGLGLIALSFLFELIYPFEMNVEELAWKSLGLLAIVQTWADFTLTLTRLMFKIMRPFIPAWNSFSQYVTQPMIFITLEIVSMLIPPFLEHDTFFIMSNAGAEFKGFDCAAGTLEADGLAVPMIEANEERLAYTSAAWCGIKGFYKEGITAMGDARRLAEQMTIDQDGWHPNTFADARRLHEAAGGRVVLPSDAFSRLVRRLDDADIAEGPDWIDVEGKQLNMIISIATFQVQMITYIISVISGLAITLLGMLADVVFHVIYVLLDEAVVLIARLVILVVKTMIQLLMSLVRSGALERIMGLMLDVIMIAVMDFMMPMIFVTMDLMMCMMHMFDASSWSAELFCIHKNCFQPDAGGSSDMILFTSYYIVVDEIVKIVQDTFNAGSRLFGLGKFDLSSGVETATAKAYNGTEGCAACFVCKVETPRSSHSTSSHTHTHTLALALLRTSPRQPRQPHQLRLRRYPRCGCSRTGSRR